MKSGLKTKSFLYGVALAFTSLSFLIKPELPPSVRGKGNGNFPEYWENIRGYFTKGLKQFDDGQEKRL